mmetsp:Transcript_45104/g.128829  ORF Transcript_45104/g.128829 Transcript_45104/m.128829 type:complete len:273 (-) Transcript_45104:85-903(-)
MEVPQEAPLAAVVPARNFVEPRQQPLGISFVQLEAEESGKALPRAHSFGGYVPHALAEARSGMKMPTRPVTTARRSVARSELQRRRTAGDCAPGLEGPPTAAERSPARCAAEVHNHPPDSLRLLEDPARQLAAAEEAPGKLAEASHEVLRQRKADASPGAEATSEPFAAPAARPPADLGGQAACSFATQDQTADSPATLLGRAGPRPPTLLERLARGEAREDLPKLLGRSFGPAIHGAGAGARALAERARAACLARRERVAGRTGRLLAPLN